MLSQRIWRRTKSNSLIIDWLVRLWSLYHSNHRTSVIYVGHNSKHSRLYHIQTRTMSTSHAQFLRVNVMRWLFLYTASNLLNEIYVSAESSNNRAAETVQYQQTAEMKADQDLPSIQSPSFRSIQQQHQSEVATFGLEVRRIQGNVAACSANPVCAAAGLVDDCCPTSAGMVLSCCSQTSPPGAFFCFLGYFSCIIYIFRSHEVSLYLTISTNI